jgi:hypothetical protein
MSSIVSIDTRGYDISMGPGFLRVGGGGGIAGNVYINGNVGIGALSSASNKLNIQSPVAKLNSYTNIGYTYPTSSVLIRNTTAASTLADRSCLINFHKYGLSGSYWDQLAAINMGLTDGHGTSLDFQVAYANGAGLYNYINALTLQSISLTNSLIGINTSTPSNATLDVSGSLRVGSGNKGIINFGQTGVGGFRSAYIYSTSTDLYILNQQPGAFQFGTNNDEKMRITADGYVGIKTTTPISFLEIHGSASTAHNIMPDGGSNHNLNLVSTKTGSSKYSMALGVDFTSGVGYINAAGNSAIQPVCLQTRGGRVGIGTTTPASTLDVNGTVSTGALNVNGDVAQTSGGLYSYMTLSRNGGANSSFINWYTANGTRLGFMGNGQISSNAGTGDMQLYFENGTTGLVITGDTAKKLTVSGSMTVGGSNGTSDPFTSFTSKKYSTAAIGFLNAFSITTTSDYGASYLEVIVMGTYSGVGEICIKYELAIAPSSGGTNLVYVNNARVASGSNLPKTLNVISGAFELRQITSGKVTTFAVYGPAITNNYGVYVRYLAGGAGNTGTITML